MRKLNFLMAFFFILTSFPLTGQKQVVKAITTVNVQSLGPQKLGNLSPVITPDQLCYLSQSQLNHNIFSHP